MKILIFFTCLLIFFTCLLMFNLSIYFITLIKKNIQDIKEKEYGGFPSFDFEEKSKKHNFFKFLKFWNYL
nr:MAG TPA: hypothetical protein [Caudovirales sp. ctnYA4]